MAEIFEGHRFEDLFDDLALPWPLRKAPRIFEDLEFRRCTFIGCHLSLSRDPRRRTVARRISLVDCKEMGCKLHAAIVEDVLVDGLATRYFHSWGAVFIHVTLRGPIGPIALSHLVTPSQQDSTVQRAFADANAAYYTTVDWALDIREAAFEEDVDVRGIPGHLIRRDPQTQVVVMRAKALEGTWRQLKLEKMYWPTAIEFFLDSGLNSTVLVAPKKITNSMAHPWNVQDLMDGLQMLRDVGVAEPD